MRQSRRASPHCWCNCDFHGLSREAELSSPVFTLAMTSRIADGTVDQRQRLTFDTLSETFIRRADRFRPQTLWVFHFLRIYSSFIIGSSFVHSALSKGAPS